MKIILTVSRIVLNRLLDLISFFCIQALPAIKSYMESGEFMRHPVNGNSASWGGK